ncbi:hypothetical protein DLE01_21650 [Streptomyces sp. FT05W]|nr:hypothetical protein DLE01_21650 [Streptomyces sp. FT05W]
MPTQRSKRSRIALVSATMPIGRGPEQPDDRLPSRRTESPKTSGRVTVYFAALLARTEDGWRAGAA